MTYHKPIVMVGTFPPPVHGMAAVNLAVKNKLIDCGGEPVVIDVASNSLKRDPFSRFSRVPKVLSGLWKLIGNRHFYGGTLYMSVSGGAGQIYEALFLLVARYIKMRIFLHHHSFAYLDKPNILTRLITKIASGKAVHITQSPGMASRLSEKYIDVNRVVPISNAVFLVESNNKVQNRKSHLETIGFISNISEEKGVFEFLNLVRACEIRNLQIRAILAGPFQDSETEKKVLKSISQLKTIEYVGPQFGDNKEIFFSSIDVLIFPTLYANETEGIVNHEAMSRGIPVIAYGRGCIRELICEQSGLVVEPGDMFVPKALSKLTDWLEFPEQYQEASASAKSCFSKTLMDASKRYDALIDELIAG